jgi:hypothetical protein
MYKVIKAFVDLQDCNFPYSVGDAFPRNGKTVTAERLAELAGNDNKQGEPLIKLVEEPKAAAPAKPAAKKPAAKKKAEK